MPVNTKEVLHVVSKLTEHKKVRVTVKESLKGGCIAAATTVVGGLLLGPAGLAIGGVVGGCTAAVVSKDKFKPIPQVIMQDMTHEQRESLVRSVNIILNEVRIEDGAVLLAFLMSDKLAAENILQVVYNFIQNEMALQIMD